MSFLDTMKRAQTKSETATTPKSLAAAQKVLAALGIKIKFDKDTDEYIVNYMKNPTEATAYFTSDLQDAIGTGQQMAKGKKEKASYSSVVKKVFRKTK